MELIIKNNEIIEELGNKDKFIEKYYKNDDVLLFYIVLSEKYQNTPKHRNMGFGEFLFTEFLPIFPKRSQEENDPRYSFPFVVGRGAFNHKKQVTTDILQDIIERSVDAYDLHIQS